MRTIAVKYEVPDKSCNLCACWKLSPSGEWGCPYRKYGMATSAYYQKPIGMKPTKPCRDAEVKG